MSNISEINGQLINAAIASLSLSASGSLTGSLLGTASWATNALTASFLPVGTYDITSSWANNATSAVSASTTNNTNSGTNRLVFANASPGTTPLYIQPFSATINPSTGHITAIAFSGSFNGNLTGTASYVTGSIYNSTNPALSSSYALTASYALNGGSGGVTLIQAGAGINVTNGSGPTVTISATSTGGTSLGLVYAVSLGYTMP